MKKKKTFKSNEITPLANGLLHVLFIFYAVLCIAPILLVIAVSLTDDSSLGVYGFRFIPKVWSLATYKYLFKYPQQIISGYAVTTFTTVFGTLVGLLMTLMYAYPISRPDFKHNKFFTFFIYFTMLFNGGLVATYITCTKLFQFTNSVHALIIPLLLNPFNVIIVRTFYKTNIPGSIIESANIDGASEFRIFWGIILPLSKPVIATIGLFIALSYWNDWFTCMLYVTKPKLFNLQYILQNALKSAEFAMQAKKMGVLIEDVPSQTLRFALAIVAIGPIILAYPFFQKYFVKGMTIGSVKG